MIHYQLKCAGGHAFDGWFASSAAYDRLRDAGAIACPHCDTTAVDRALMAPALAKGGSARDPASQPEFLPPVDSMPNVATDDRATSGVAADDRAQKMRAALRAMRQAVIENGDDVGRSFPEEARRIHYGEAEPRGIYGQAELDEAKELLSEGISILPLPVLPEERN